VDPRKEIGYTVLLAALYFASVYFAVTALIPGSLAFQAALLAVALAMLAYRILGLPTRDVPGIPWGLMLLLLPGICVLVGGVWWILRWLGLGVIQVK
jgi:hypothetical protein